MNERVTIDAMKTREEIEQEYQNNAENLFVEYGDRIRELAKVRDAALAELDDPTARLIAAFKEHMNCRECWPLCISCHKTLRDAIDYAEQRRAQWL